MSELEKLRRIYLTAFRLYLEVGTVSESKVELWQELYEALKSYQNPCDGCKVDEYYCIHCESNPGRGMVK